jgi:hypothetical protein
VGAQATLHPTTSMAERHHRICIGTKELLIKATRCREGSEGGPSVENVGIHREKKFFNGTLT